MSGMMIKQVTKQGYQEYDLFSWELENRTIRLTGKIDDSMADEVIAKIEYLDSRNHDPIRIVINSPGGSVSSGLAILDAMRGAKSEIETVCTGIAASMGAYLVACGGTKGRRFITLNAEMMIHQPLTGVSGQAVDVEMVAFRISEIRRKLVWMLSQATGQSCERIFQDTDRDFYLNADDAVEYGLVDHIA